MIPSRGKGSYPNRGGRGRGQYPLIQHGSTRLIAKNIASSSTNSTPIPIPGDPLYDDFQKFLKEKGINNPNYAQAVLEGDNVEDTSEYIQSPYKEDIILLENREVMLYFENNNDPWFLMTRYLDTASFTSCSYKPRIYYEQILISTGSVDFSHFKTGNNTAYNFSKAIIKRVIAAEDWGLSTLREKEFTVPESKNIFKFNYWDYIDSFHKAFLYENPNRKHSWFFKVCENVFKQNIPVWFIKWWMSYGPSIDILPEDPFKKLYGEWIAVSPKYKEASTQIKGGTEVIPSLYFFIEFSIPWIWKWVPQVDYSPNKFSSLQRLYLTKFWPKMLTKDPVTKELQSKQTIDNIKQKIQQYKAQMEFSRNEENIFKKIADNLKANTDKEPSKEEMIKAYLARMKEDLIKNFDQPESSKSTKSDSSMMSNEDENQLCLAGESQMEEETIPLDYMFDMIEDRLLRKNLSEDKGSTVQ